MMPKRRPNFRFLLLMIVPTVVVGAGVHVLHGRQLENSSRLILRQAERAEDRGDQGEALGYLNRYIGLRPNDAEANARAGLIRADRAEGPRDHLQALLVLERALRLEPGRDDVRRRAVEVAMRPELERYTDAEAHLKVLKAKEPEDAELSLLMGRALEGNGDYREAVDAYRETLERDPSRIDAYTRLAALYRDHLNDAAAADRLMDAQGTAEGVVAKNTGSARAFLERGLYRAQHGIEGADLDIGRALELDPDDPEILLAAAEDALRRDDAQSARSHLERALERSPDDPAVYLLRARVEIADGHSEQAVAVLRRGIEALAEGGTDGRILLLWELADLQINEGRLEDAEGVIEELRAAKIRPEFLEFLGGRLLAGRGRWREAISRLEAARTKLIGQDDVTYQIDLLLGALHGRIGNTDGRLAAYRRATSADPSALPGRLGLASALADQGRLDEAIAIDRLLVDQVPGLRLEIGRLQLARVLSEPEERRDWAPVDRALDLAEAEQTDSAEVDLLRARSLLARGRIDEARDLLARTVEQHPENPSARVSLAGLIGVQGNPEAAARELDELQARLGDTVASRLARASYWASRGGDEATAALDALEEGLDRFDEEDRQRLLDGLIAARRQRGDLGGAERLLGDLIGLRPEAVGPRLLRLELISQRIGVEASGRVREGIDAILDDQPPDDVPTLLRLFDLATAVDPEARARRVLQRLRSVEGNEGASWRQAEARLLAVRAERGAEPAEKRTLLARARVLLEEAAQRRPGWTLVPLTLAAVEQLDGNPSAAIIAYEQAKELGVRDREVLLRLYRLYAAAGRTEQAGALVAEIRGLGFGDDDGQLARIAAESKLRDGEDPEGALNEARTAVPDDSEDHRDHLWLAQFLDAAGRAEEAEAEIRKAVALAPEEPAPHETLVRFLAASGRTEAARDAIERAEAELPDNRAALALARCYAAVGDLDRAEKTFEAAIADAPRDPSPLRAASAYALANGRVDRAEDYLERLGRLDAEAPEDASWARRTLPLVLAASGDPSKRREALRRLGDGDGVGAVGRSIDDLRARAQTLALQVDSASKRQAVRLLERIIDRESAGTPDDRFLLAQLFELDGQWDRARGLMRGLTASEDSNPAHLARYLGWLLAPGPDRRRDPDPEAARPLIDRLKRIAPEAIQTAEADARYLDAVGRDVEAVDALRRYAEAHPEQGELAARLAEEIGSPALAEPLYRRLVERADDPEALRLLAGNLERQGGDHLVEAERFYRRYTVEASRPEAGLALAGFHARQGRIDEALALCEAARADCAPEVVASAVLSLVFERDASTDQLERAGRIIEDELAEAPDNIMLLFQLANLRSLQGRHDEVEPLFRRAVERAPDAPGPRNNLAWFLALKDPAEPVEALEQINRAIADIGPDPNLLDTRAVVFLRLDRADEAIADLREAIAKLRRPDPLFYVHLAEAHLQGGDLPDAADALSRARELGLDEAAIPPLERPAFDRLVRRLAEQT